MFLRRSLASLVHAYKLHVHYFFSLTVLNIVLILFAEWENKHMKLILNSLRLKGNKNVEEERR